MDGIIQFSHLIGMGFKIYGWLVVAAFALTWIDADPSNGIVQFINRTTRPFWDWISRGLPYKYASYAPLAALFAIDFGEIFFPGMIRSFGSVGLGASAPEAGFYNVALYAGLGGLIVAKSILFFVMILSLAYLVISIVRPPLSNPLVRNITWLIDPVITPLQRILPRAKIDLSPIVITISIFFALQTMVPMIMDLQAQLTA